MKFFIDTANVDEIREISKWGILDGVTTNPSLIAKEGRDFVEVITEITSIVDGPISAEVISLEAEGMVKEARELCKINKNIVIKIPMTEEGLKAVNVEGMILIEDIFEVFSNYAITTEIIAASVRTPMHVLQIAKSGADIATVPYKVFKQMLKHPLTDIGIEKFLKDWESVK